MIAETGIRRTGISLCGYVIVLLNSRKGTLRNSTL
jgi:hypothetical protein